MRTSTAKFTSDRERRLWLGALAVTIAIYATLGLAGTAAGVLRERNLLGLSFAAGFALVIAAIIGIAIRAKPRKREIWVALGIAAAYGMIVVRMGISPEERTHLFEYGLLSVLIHQALAERVRNGRNVPVPPIVAIVVTILLGWLDEGIQALLPNRVYDLRDVGINASAAVMATVASLVITRIRVVAFKSEAVESNDQGEATRGEPPSSDHRPKPGGSLGKDP